MFMSLSCLYILLYQAYDSLSPLSIFIGKYSEHFPIVACHPSFYWMKDITFLFESMTCFWNF